MERREEGETKMNKIELSLLRHIEYVQNHFDVDEVTSFFIAEALVGELLE